MIQNAKAILNRAFENKYAIPQFNINNLESAKAILEVAKETNSPVIIGVSEGAVKYIGGYNSVVYMIKGLIKDLSLEKLSIVIHLDHGTSFENCKKAIDAGFTSVMFDGSLKDINDNFLITKKVVDYAKKFNVSVEAEVGIVGGSEDGIEGEVRYASLEECKKISSSNIDMLAASLGSVHGRYKSEPKLGFNEMKLFAKEIKLPLVLHGASWISDSDIKRAIENGISKININTEIQESFSKGIRKYIEEELDLKDKGYDPRKVVGTYSYKYMKETIKSKIILFNSINKNNIV